MNSFCDLCRGKPALTKCRKGALCKACGDRCHPNYQHDVEFVIHAPEESMLTRKTVTKSTVLLTKKSTSQLPYRLTKVHSQLRRPKSQVQPSMSKTNSASVYKQNKAILANSKTDHLQSCTEIAQKSIIQRVKQSLVVNQKSTPGKLKDEQARRLKEEQSRRLKDEQIRGLKGQVEYQNKLLKLLAAKLQKQRNHNKKIKSDYEQKLKLIRKLRQ